MSSFCLIRSSSSLVVPSSDVESDPWEGVSDRCLRCSSLLLAFFFAALRLASLILRFCFAVGKGS